MTDRYETNFAINCSKKIRKRVVSSLIGKGGVNIRRLRSKVGNKTFIKFYKIDYGKKEKAKLEECDTVYISSRSEIAIRKAAKILKMNIRNIKDGSNNSEFNSEFKELIEVDAKSVGTIIGFKGTNLESIMKLAGPYCYIVYKKEENGFLVIGNTKDEIVKAKEEILKRQEDYFINQHIWNESTQCKDKISKLVNLENIVESDSGSVSASVSVSGSVSVSKMTLKITNIKEGSSRNKVKQSLKSTKLFKNNEKLMDVLCDLASEQSRIRKEDSTSILSYDSDLEDDLPALDSESFNWL